MTNKCDTDDLIRREEPISLPPIRLIGALNLLVRRVDDLQVVMATVNQQADAVCSLLAFNIKITLTMNNKQIEKHNDILDILNNWVASIPKEQHQFTLMSIINKFEAHENLSEEDKSIIQDVISDKLVNSCLNSEFEPTNEGLYLEELIDYISNL